MHLQSSLLATLDLRAPWAVDFMRGSGSPAHYIVSGDAWLETSGERVHLTAGDLVMFPRWDHHIMRSAPEVPSETIIDIVTNAGSTPWMPGDLPDQPIRVEWGGDGALVQVLSMTFRLEDPEHSALLLGLPGFMHIRAGDARMRQWLQPVLEFIAEETAAQQAGYALVSSRLADLLFMQIVRAQLVLRPEEVTGWLRGLSDPAIGRALAAIGSTPGRRWRVADLAKVAHLSRSSFAARFKSVTGVTPMEHITGHRMQIAAERLALGARVATLAQELGYATSYAFTKAFKRVHGQSPGRFARARQGRPGGSLTFASRSPS